MKWLLAVLIALSFSAAASAQGLQCRTSPPGASTPYCASEAFVSESVATAGDVKGPASAIAGHIATFADTTGKVIEDGGAPAAGTVTEQKNTGSVGIATSGNCDNTSSNASSPCDHHLALNNATLQASPSNPAGANSVSPLMMGLGGACNLTLVYGSRVLVEFQGYGTNSSPTNAFEPQVYFGTGSAPANQAAATGTTIGSKPIGIINGTGVTSYLMPFKIGGIVTGLTHGTAYWFDVGVANNGAGTASINNVSCTAMEF